MARHVFEEQIDNLHRKLMTMGSLVEEAIHKSVRSLLDRDLTLAEEVIENDERINRFELEIESACFQLIALQQPVGGDLRRIGATLKLVTDLERMGDHAVSVAKTAKRLSNEPAMQPIHIIPVMADHVKTMVRDSLNAYIARDVQLAEEVALRDDVVDKYYSTMFREMIDEMTKNGAFISQGTHLLMVAQYLERIADHVTNICEWVVYLNTGEIADLNK